MKTFLAAQSLLLALGTSTISHYLDWQRGLSFGSGAGLVLINAAVLALFWSRVFQKKQIALSTGLIVFKYALLGAAIFWILSQPWSHPLWVGLGVGSLMISALATTLETTFKKE